MKNKLFTITFILVFCSIRLFSQITLTAGENSFTVGESVTYFEVFGADNFDPGDEGANIVWDFSNKVETGDNNIIDYVTTVGKPHINIMTGADVAEQLNSQTNGYFYFDNAGQTRWNRSGFYANDGGIEIWLAYNGGPLQLYPGNFTYLTHHQVVPFGATGGWYMSGTQDEAIIPNAGEYYFDCDSYGRLMLPHRIYLEALRVNVIEEFQIQILFYGTPLITMTIEDNAYFWFVDGVKGPVFAYIESNNYKKDITYSLQWQKPYDDLYVDFESFDNETGNMSTSGDTDDIFEMLNLSYPLNDGSEFLWEFNPSTVEFEEGTDENSVHPKVRFTEAGIYDVTCNISNSNFNPSTANITKEDYIEIEEAPALVVDFAADYTEIALNGIANFTSSVTLSTGNPVEGTTSYYWQVSPGAAGVHWNFTNFTNNTDEDPSIQFYAQGCYSIQLEVTNENYSNSPVTVTKFNYIDVDEGCSNDVGEIIQKINIYPNPGDGKFSIEVPVRADLYIYEPTGKIIYNTVADSETTTLDLSHLGAGIYLVKLITDKQTFTEKIIIE